MAIVYSVPLKLVLELSIKSNISESQIRSYIAGFETDATQILTDLVTNAPPVAQASIDRLDWVVKVVPRGGVGSGRWQIYPKPDFRVSVADTITVEQVLGYVRTCYDDFKTLLRTMINGAPPGAQAALLSWHIHRLTVDGVMSESDEVEP